MDDAAKIARGLSEARKFMPDLATATIEGETFQTGRWITEIDVWRQTPFGPVNFGCVIIGPTLSVRAHLQEKTDG